VWKTSVGIEDRTAHNLVVAGTTVIVTASSKPCYVEGGESDGNIVAFNLTTGAHLCQLRQVRTLLMCGVVEASAYR
jgi:hypothetical protein